MAISKILDFSAGSKFAIKLPQDIRYDRESQNCVWILFSVTPLLNLADSLRTGLLLRSIEFIRSSPEVNRKRDIFDNNKVFPWPLIIFGNQNLLIWIDFIITLLSDERVRWCFKLSLFYPSIKVLNKKMLFMDKDSNRIPSWMENIFFGSEKKKLIV